MAKRFPVLAKRCLPLKRTKKGGVDVGLRAMREKYARIYRDEVAPKKKGLVITPEVTEMNKHLCNELSTLRKQATTIGLGGKLPDER